MSMIRGIARQTEDRVRGVWTVAGAIAVTWTVRLFVTAAQAEQTARPPEGDRPWLQWLLVFAFAGLCCGVAFKNPKRSHQN